MAVALRKRFANQKDEILRFTRMYGRYKAAETLAFDRLLMEWTNEQDYGVNPQITLDTRKSIGDQLLEAIVRKISSLEHQNEDLKEQFYLLRQMNDSKHKEQKITDDVERILNMCEVPN